MASSILPDTMRALVVEDDNGTPKPIVRTIDQTYFDTLYPDGDTLIRIDWSSLNYKDAMALCGNRSRILRRIPIVPGVDLAGEIIETSHPDLKQGMTVLATGYGLGETLSGGFSSHARIHGKFLLPIPEPLDPKQAMQIGTAGFTAMLAVRALRRQCSFTEGAKIAVTGAGGGVGSQAIAILNAYGYSVTALTSKNDQTAYFRNLGASTIASITELTGPNKPLVSPRWAGGIDTAGGEILANLLATTEQNGAIAACGLASSPKLITTVLPFILRGVALLGIDSVYCPRDERIRAWADLAKLRDHLQLADLCDESSLDQLGDLADNLLANRRRGRILVKTS